MIAANTVSCLACCTRIRRIERAVNATAATLQHKRVDGFPIGIAQIWNMCDILFDYYRKAIYAIDYDF